MKKEKAVLAATLGKTGNRVLHSSGMKTIYLYSQGQESPSPYLWCISVVLALWCGGLL
jgi:hypothetical protein